MAEGLRELGLAAGAGPQALGTPDLTTLASCCPLGLALCRLRGKGDLWNGLEGPSLRRISCWCWARRSLSPLVAHQGVQDQGGPAVPVVDRAPGRPGRQRCWDRCDMEAQRPTAPPLWARALLSSLRDRLPGRKGRLAWGVHQLPAKPAAASAQCQDARRAESSRAEPIWEADHTSHRSGASGQRAGPALECPRAAANVCVRPTTLEWKEASEKTPGPRPRSRSEL